ncbi:MAG TPA: hypothetical protein VMF58_04035 [Rhizomicrobium sp.]|nr:hypothetical protein [Rhizomicrobium sp.]
MKRTLALAAAALLCTTGAALARHHHGKPVTVDLGIDGFCNIYHVTYSTKTSLATAQDTPSCTGTYGGGMLAQTKPAGDVMLLALQDPQGQPGVQLMVQFSYPFTTGGTVTIFQTTDGTTFTDAFDGTYTVETGTRANGGSKPVQSAFRK